MVVAVVAVGVVQASIDEVVGVVAVRDRLMATSRAVLVAALVAGCGIGVACRVLGVDSDDVLVDVVLVGVVEVSVVEVVHVVPMLNSGVSAARAVDVGVIGVHVMLGHRSTVGFGVRGA